MINQYLNHVRSKYIVNLLRSQVKSLNEVITQIERSNNVNGYVDENLRRIDQQFRQTKRLNSNG